MQKRFENIDLLRGLSIIVMILTHTNAYFLANKFAFNMWNYLHFAVPTFVFCSGFVLSMRYKIDILSIKTYLSFVVKRLARLLKPYYIFLIFFYTMLYFSQKKLEWNDVFSALLIVREPDISWLVNLFVQLTLLFPIFSYLFVKKRKLFNIIFIGVFSLAFWKIFGGLSIDYKTYMVYLWLLPFLFAFYYGENYKSKSFKVKSLVFFVVLHSTLRYYLNIQDMNLIYQDNKYPPNLYYLTYGISWFIFLDLIFSAPIFVNKILSRTIIFFSKYSFPLFFIHYLVIQVTFRFYIKYLTFNELTLFLYVIIISSIIQLLLNKVLSMFNVK